MSPDDLTPATGKNPSRLRRVLRIVGIILAVLIGILVLAVWQRHTIITHVIKLNPELGAKEPAVEGVDWFDDYYTVEEIGPGLYAIGEPRYHQRNYNYLIVGTQEALLLDVGPGLRDIRPVVESLTDRPYMVVFSHFHFDHVGAAAFERIAVIDLPHLRARTVDGKLELLAAEHLGNIESIEKPTIKVSRWLASDAVIDLGGRRVQVLYTPGHTTESISVYDETSNILLSGDWFTEALVPMFENSSLGEMNAALRLVMRSVPKTVRIFSAHKLRDGTRAPQPLTYGDLELAASATSEILEGTRTADLPIFPAIYYLSERLTLYADIPWFQRRDISYPQLLGLQKTGELQESDG